MKTIPFVVTALLSASALSAQAATLNVTRMVFTGGTFAIPFVTPTPSAMAGSTENLVDGYHVFPNLVINGLCGCAMHFYTSDGTTAPLGGTPIGGGPVPSATVDTMAGTLTVDLSSWTAQWNGTNFDQGAANVTGPWNPVTGAYSIAWNSLIIGGPFNGLEGAYTLTGVATVPEAETYAMMLAGIALIGTAARRRAT